MPDLFSLCRSYPIYVSIQFWQQSLPEALENGQVILQGTCDFHHKLNFDTDLAKGNDFFTGQPVKNAAVYFMRMILHDWSDEYCVKILKHLRAAAAPVTNLLIIHSVMSYACSDDTSLIDVPGAEGQLPPAPLLPNNGHANIAGYLGDIQVFHFRLKYYLLLISDIGDGILEWPRADATST